MLGPFFCYKRLNTWVPRIVLIELFEGPFYNTFKKRDQTLPNPPSINLKILTDKSLSVKTQSFVQNTLQEIAQSKGQKLEANFERVLLNQLLH